MKRLAEASLRRLLGEFPVTTILGLRQVGKTTLARSLPGRTYVTLDDVGALEAARRDPAGFVAGLPRPVTIDEVQRAPGILLPVKREVDRRRRPGAFLLTGSARIDLRRDVSDTLAGRMALLRLRPMTWSERARRPEWNSVDVLFACATAAAVARRFEGAAALDAGRVLAGGLPVPFIRLRGAARGRWLGQYRSAYVERDVPPLLRVDEVARLIRYVTLVASRTAQTLNLASLGREVGITTDTATRWLGVLEATFLVDLVPPYFRNIGKRLVKAPKVHLGDAGLAAHFTGVASWREALRLNHAGPLLETLVAQHLLAFADLASKPTAVFHYRTQAGAEVDFVISRGSRLIPIEVKAARSVRAADVGGLRAFLRDFEADAPFGVVAYGGDEVVPLGHRILAVPLAALLEGVATHA